MAAEGIITSVHIDGKGKAMEIPEILRMQVEESSNQVIENEENEMD